MAAIRSGATPGPTPNPYRGNNADYPDYLRDTPAPDYAGYGQRARRTMPMPPEDDLDDLAFARDADLELQFRVPCHACGGQGTVSGREASCRVCHRRFSYEDVKHSERFGFGGRWVRLPCTHEIKGGDLIWHRPRCEACRGDGYRYRWIRCDDWVNARYPEDESNVTTAAMHALAQASQAHHRDEFARSGEPTAPPARPDRHTPTPDYYQQQQQQRHTPNPYSPHMAPLTPHVVTPLRPDDSDTRRF